ncbi:MAG TPA: DNA translocase FtsK [Candidatus Bipolaricaulota bacterium]|nr:DNA translocase FtsK [Candidatus Bipolaricaulota bacterium]
MARRKRKKIKEEPVREKELSPEAKKGIVVVFIFAVGVLSFLSLLQMAGRIGIFIDSALSIFIGWTKYAFPILMIIYAYLLFRDERYQITKAKYVGFLFFVLSFNALLHISYAASEALEMSASGLGGGFLGLVLSYPLQFVMGKIATIVILLALLLISLLLMFNTSIKNLVFGNSRLAFLKRPFGVLFARKEDESSEEESETETVEKATQESSIENEEQDEKKVAKELNESEETAVQFPNKGIKIDLPLTLLNKKTSKPTSGDTKVGMEKIQKTLENFGIDVQMEGVSIGPTVTQYTFKPAEGVKLSRITALNNDLALALAAHPLRIEAPIPGKSLVGIEVPNKQAATVCLRELLEAPEFKTRKSNLALTLGKDVSGKTWVYPLEKMPHLLVAGATGSGKSVCLNTMIISLLYQNNPDDLRMILVDPKRVEFPVYNGIPHLLSPVITDVTKTVNSLRWAISEMDRRYEMLAKSNKRNIEGYNQSNPEEKLPYLLIVIDELADLMISASSEIESSIIRLTQMARAIGIHLIVATQRPSVDVITGLIKANIPARIAFSVASQTDSRTILDSSGAEKLLGKGDMLFQTAELSKPRRIQGAFVGDDEIKRVVDFLKEASGDPEYNESVTEKNKGVHTSFDYNNDDGDSDELYDDAVEIVARAGKASASLLQRRLRVGYARAARLIDLLEDNGVVGPADGARPREVLMSLDKMSQGDAHEAAPTEDDEENEE